AALTLRVVSRPSHRAGSRGRARTPRPSAPRAHHGGRQWSEAARLEPLSRESQPAPRPGAARDERARAASLPRSLARSVLVPAPVFGRGRAAAPPRAAGRPATVDGAERLRGKALRRPPWALGVRLHPHGASPRPAALAAPSAVARPPRTAPLSSAGLDVRSPPPGT